MSFMSSIIDIRNLEVFIDEKLKYKTDDDIHINYGDYIIIKGWNGVGKSTLLNIINNGLHKDI